MKVMSKVAFILGVLVAVILGMLPSLGSEKIIFGLSAVNLAIIAIGIVVAIMNLKGTKTSNFLVTITALLVIGNAGLFITSSSVFLEAIMINIVAFVVPSAILIALKSVHELVTA